MKTSRTLGSVMALLLFTPLLPAASGRLVGATYTHELNTDQSPKDRAESFRPGDTVCLSVELKGRPKAGIVAAKFMFRDQVIAEAKVDVADVNKGVLFSVGRNTFVGFSLKPANPLPVGPVYRTEVTFDGAPLGGFPFAVAPPEDSIPSTISAVTLARAVGKKNEPLGQTREFTTDQKVVLAGRGDLGNGSWIEVNWLVGGRLDPGGTKSFTIKENKKDVPFYFSYLPTGGWPVGAHEVVLIVDGKVAAREKFATKAGAATKPGKLAVSAITFHRDDGKGRSGEVTESFGPDDRILHARFVLAAPAPAQGARIAWILVEAANARNQELAVAVINNEMPQPTLAGFLRTKKGLPQGHYRVELLQGDDLVAGKDFEVKGPAGGGSKSKD